MAKQWTVSKRLTEANTKLWNLKGQCLSDGISEHEEQQIHLFIKWLNEMLESSPRRKIGRLEREQISATGKGF